jgi:DNA-binding response OmpR family regulator
MPRLLIVDDQFEICDVIGAYCHEEGYAVTTACDGISAQEQLEREEFDALIVDVVLADVSGFKLADLASARGIPVLMISGEPRTIDKLNESGRYLFLQKPFHLTELGSALRSLLTSDIPNLSHMASDERQNPL